MAGLGIFVRRLCSLGYCHWSEVLRLFCVVLSGLYDELVGRCHVTDHLVDSAVDARRGAHLILRLVWHIREPLAVCFEF